MTHVSTSNSLSTSLFKRNDLIIKYEFVHYVVRMIKSNVMRGGVANTIRYVYNINATYNVYKFNINPQTGHLKKPTTSLNDQYVLVNVLHLCNTILLYGPTH